MYPSSPPPVLGHPSSHSSPRSTTPFSQKGYLPSETHRVQTRYLVGSQTYRPYVPQQSRPRPRVDSPNPKYNSRASRGHRRLHTCLTSNLKCLPGEGSTYTSNPTPEPRRRPQVCLHFFWVRCRYHSRHVRPLPSTLKRVRDSLGSPLSQIPLPPYLPQHLRPPREALEISSPSPVLEGESKNQSRSLLTTFSQRIKSGTVMFSLFPYYPPGLTSPPISSVPSVGSVPGKTYRRFCPFPELLNSPGS